MNGIIKILLVDMMKSAAASTTLTANLIEFQPQQRQRLNATNKKEVQIAPARYPFAAADRTAFSSTEKLISAAALFSSMYLKLNNTGKAINPSSVMKMHA